MNRTELVEILTDALKKKYVETRHYNGRIIVDVRVEVSEECFDDESGGYSFDTIKVEVETQSPKGKNHRWDRIYL